MKVGNKVLGFKFEDHYNHHMDLYIDKVGEIIEIRGNRILVKFPCSNAWCYPKE